MNSTIVLKQLKALPAAHSSDANSFLFIVISYLVPCIFISFFKKVAAFYCRPAGFDHPAGQASSPFPKNLP
jgi:hypothetical protein